MRHQKTKAQIKNNYEIITGRETPKGKSTIKKKTMR